MQKGSGRISRQSSKFPHPPFGQGGMGPAIKETARFVMFKDAFDKVINTGNLLEIEKAESVQKTEAYRVFPVKQETLLEEGWEQPKEESSGFGVKRKGCNCEEA